MGFQQGLSGLNVSSRNLEVIGNNVANAGTYGAKASRAEFADMYASALNGAGTSSPGIGATVQAVSQQFSQGNITTTENPLDLAVNGNGFFQLKDSRGQTFYSRNGQFKVDRDGFIVNNSKHQLIGYQADTTGKIITSDLTPLQLPTGGIAPKQTDSITLEMNLKSTDDIKSVPINLADNKTYNFTTSQTVYDVKGQPVGLGYYFQKTANNSWDVYVTANGTSVQVDGAGNPAKVATLNFAASGGTPTDPTNVAPAAGNPGTITTYDPTGAPLSTVAGGVFSLPTIPKVNIISGTGTPPLPQTEAISGIKMDMSKSTEYGANYSVTNLTQSGYAPGDLASITVDSSGIVLARYSNGQSKPAGQVVMASFRNPQGLQPEGNNEWTATFASNAAITGTPGTGNLGLLQSGALEESNVDLTGELVNMMMAQRMYQANAQTIKTEDQVMQTLVNMR
ncbi:MAG: flagellar hook protein FlgE [Burkholderiales bacterium]|nr:flagellar hook protein FlgE [Burkholderiales bacterium]